MRRWTTVLVVACALAGGARGELINFGFTVPGGGAGIAYGQSLTALGLSPGMPMRGTVAYDTATSGTTAADGTRVYSSPGRMTVEVGGQTFVSAPATPLRLEWHPPRPPGPFGFPLPGMLWVRATPEDPGLFGGPAGDSYLMLTFYPAHGQTWTGSLPMDLAEFAGGRGTVEARFSGPNPGFFDPALYMLGHIDGMTRQEAVSQIPEPAALTLAALGVPLALLRSRRR